MSKLDEILGDDPIQKQAVKDAFLDLIGEDESLVGEKVATVGPYSYEDDAGKHFGYFDVTGLKEGDSVKFCMELPDYWRRRRYNELKAELRQRVKAI